LHHSNASKRQYPISASRHHCIRSEGVKKLKIPKIHFRKSLIRNKACTGSSEFFQFFHSFSVKAGRARHPVRAVVPSHQSARTE